MSLPRLSTGLLLVGALAYAAFTLASAPWWTVDDAYILFRYAQHWVTTGIPTWNPGEPAVEGYTGTLYLALLAAASALGVPLEATAKAIGLLSYALTGLLVWFLLHQLGVRPLLRAWGSISYFSAAFLFPHALSGIETMLFTALLTAAVWLSLRTVATEVSPTTVGVTHGTLAAVALTRPEGTLFALCLLLAVHRTPPKDTADREELRGAVGPWQRVWSWLTSRGWAILLFALPLIGVTLWRWSLYGELVPNTYFAKRAEEFGLGALLSLLEFALHSWAVPGVLLLLFSLPEWERWTTLLRSHYRRFLPVLLALCAAAAVIVVEYSRSTLQMNYSHRFWIMLYPLGLCVAAAGIEHGLRALEATREHHPLRFRRIRQAGVWLTLLQLAVHVGLWRWEERKFLRDYRQLLQEEHAVAAELLRGLLPQDAWIVVYPDAGLIPYRTGLPTIDGGRLNDRFLARHHWSGTPRDSAILSYFFARNPAAFIFKSRRDDRLVLNGEAAALSADPRFQPYRLVATFRTHARRFADSYFLLLYVHERVLTVRETPSVTRGAQSARAE